MAREYHYVESLSEQSTTADTPQVAASLVFTPKADTNYIIIATYEIKVNSTSYAVLSRLRRMSGTEENLPGGFGGFPQDPNDYFSVGAAGIEQFGASPTEQTYQVHFYKNTTSGTAYIRNVRLIALEMTDNDGWGDSRSAYQTNSSSYLDVPSVQTGEFRPSSQDLHYVMITAGLVSFGSNSYDYLMRVQNSYNSNVFGEINKEPNSSANLENYFHIERITVPYIGTAGWHNYKQQIAGETSAYNFQSSAGMIALLWEDEFVGVTFGQDNTEDTITTATWTDKLTVNVSAKPVNYLIFGSGRIGNESTAESAHMRLLVNGVAKGETDQETQDASSRWNAPIMTKELLTEATIPVKLQYRSDDSFSDSYLGNANIIAIQLDSAGKSVEAKARIKYAGTARTVTAKARVKYAAVTKTIQAKARVRKPKSVTVQAKASVKLPGITKTVTARTRILVFGVTKTVTARARVLSTATRTLTAKATIVQLGARTIQAKARLIAPKNVSVQAKATVAQAGVTRTVQAKAKVVNSVQRTVNVKASLENFTINIPTNYLIPSRRGKISLGFFPEVRQYFIGSSGMVKTSRSQKRAQIHFEDELSALDEFKLSSGSLQQDIRTDRYIWGILDEVYAGYFTEIATFDTDETWTNGSQDTTNHRAGDACRSLSSTNEVTATMYQDFGTSLDLSAYNAVRDYIGFFMNVDDLTKLQSWTIKLGNTAMTDYFSYTKDLNQMTSGWNQIWVGKGYFSPTGSPDWATIDRVQIEITAISGETVTCIFDALRIAYGNKYPQRIFDVGLQNIPVAWWAGNTALYEIRTASEAEAARFFADNTGALNFWNRQHFNNNPELKNAKHQFEFNRMFDLEHPNDQTKIINKVVVKVNPRKVVDSAEEIWRNPTIPSIAGGGTKTIWASFIDPAPTTTGGIIEPVSATDFTGNTQADGGGSDKTAQLEIQEFTRFTTSAKIVVKNNDAGAVYLTLLKVRGTPAKKLADELGTGQSTTIEVRVQDDTSIAKYGERPSGGLTIENKYLENEDDAEAVATEILNLYKDPLKRIVLKARAIPQVTLGDMISVVNKDTGITDIMRVMALKLQLTPDGFNQEISARSVIDIETLDYFAIGTSAIEGSEVISP